MNNNFPDNGITKNTLSIHRFWIHWFYFITGGLGGSGAVDATGKPYGSVTYPVEPGMRIVQIILITHEFLFLFLTFHSSIKENSRSILIIYIALFI